MHNAGIADKYKRHILYRLIHLTPDGGIVR